MTSHPVQLQFTPDSFKDLENLSKSLNMSAERVIAQAIALFKFAQGRKIILKSETDSVEISNYENTQVQVKLEK